MDSTNILLQEEVVMEDGLMSFCEGFSDALNWKRLYSCYVKVVENIKLMKIMGGLCGFSAVASALDTNRFEDVCVTLWEVAFLVIGHEILTKTGNLWKRVQ